MWIGSYYSLFEEAIYPQVIQKEVCSAITVNVGAEEVDRNNIWFEQNGTTYRTELVTTELFRDSIISMNGFQKVVI